MPSLIFKVVVVGGFAPSLINFRGDLLRALARHGQVLAVSDFAKPEVVAQLQEWGVAHTAVPIARNGINPCEDVRTFGAMREVLRKCVPEVLLAYTAKPIIWGGLALRALGSNGRRTRFVALITGLGFAFESRQGFRGVLQWLVAQLYRQSLYRADAVIFQNPDNRDEFVRRGIVPRALTHVVAGSGVDLVRFALVPLPPMQSQTLTFLLIARLLGEKGIREYAQAARDLKVRYPRCRCVLVGPLDSSPDGLQLDELAQWSDLDYRGALEDVRAAIAECHVYVLPSYHEGMPRTILEAMAMGRPILTTDVSGCRETVQLARNGWTVPKADANALAEKMMWFVEHTDQIAAMGVASRQLAEEHFDVHAVNRQMLRIMGVGEGQPLGEADSSLSK